MGNDERKEYNFSLTIDEVNLALNGLAELPFKVANPIVQKLMQQYQEQLPKPTEAEAE